MLLNIYYQCSLEWSYTECSHEYGHAVHIATNSFAVDYEEHQRKASVLLILGFLYTSVFLEMARPEHTDLNVSCFVQGRRWATCIAPVQFFVRFPLHVQEKEGHPNLFLSVPVRHCRS